MIGVLGSKMCARILTLVFLLRGMGSETFGTMSLKSKSEGVDDGFRASFMVAKQRLYSYIVIQNQV